jgi:diguanylate cyclase (GGDEF)-like protein
LTPNCILIRRDGYESAIDDSAAPIHDRKGNITGAVIVFHDVSATRAMSLQISHLAQYDFLTDLPNRLLLSERLTHALALARRRTTQLAVLFVDLDGFKHINDSLGHVVGDRLLQSVAARLSSCVRASDTVSRQGGDEFVILLSEIGHREDAAVGADKVLAALVRPHDVATHDLHITGTIGISVYPDDGQDAETLINAADTAMYHAKKISPNTYQFFKPAMNARAIERHWIEGGLRRALERRQFVLHYQPKVNLETGAMTGVEALIRWMHPQRGLLLPTQFVPVAEECGLIVPIGRWVLEEACRQNREWRDQGLPPLTVSINISAVEFRHAGLVENVCAVLQTNHLEAQCLELEVTESALMQHAEFTVAVLQELKTVGVPIAVDDFGTGYSSLSYLRRFPIDVLKIDQSFVRQIEVDPTATPLVTAVIAMGKSLQLRVVAEGIETHAQLAFLQGERCDEGQGYYFRPPVVAAQLGKLLEARLGGAQSFTSW